MKEIWKNIPNYIGYQASNLGRIRTFNKTTYTELHGIRKWKNKILAYKSKNGLPEGYRVDLWKNGKPKTFLVARLICTTFLENLIDTKMTVNHKDGNRLNNNIDNLEWLTLGDNIRHAFKNNFYKQTKIILENITTKEKYIFRSLSMGDRYLKRCNGYLHGCIKYTRNPKDINGIEYIIVEVNSSK